MNSSIESLYKRLSGNNFKKEAKLGDLLSTQVWVLTDESALNGGSLKKNNAKKKSIARAIETLTLTTVNAKVKKEKNLILDSQERLWKVDTENLSGNNKKEAEFINSKPYILNPEILNNPDIYPELTSLQNNEPELSLPTFTGGGERSIIGEITAIFNTINIGGEMSGGSVYLDEALRNAGDAGLNLSKEDQERLKLLAAKSQKYSERVNVVNNYLKAYQHVPEGKKTGNVKDDVDKHYDDIQQNLLEDQHKLKIINRSLLDHLKRVVKNGSKNNKLTTNPGAPKYKKITMFLADRVSQLGKQHFRKLGPLMKKMFELKKDKANSTQLAQVKNELAIKKKKLDHANKKILNLKSIKKQMQIDKRIKEKIKNKKWFKDLINRFDKY